MKNANAAPQVIVEFRNGGDEETVNYRDKKTNQPASFKKRTYNCETELGILVFQLPREEEVPKDYKFMALTRGKKYQVALSNYMIDQGIQKATGIVVAEVTK